MGVTVKIFKLPKVAKETRDWFDENFFRTEKPSF
jgi:hypothetical protein